MWAERNVAVAGVMLGWGRGAETWVFFRLQVCLHLWFSSVYTPEMVPRAWDWSF